MILLFGADGEGNSLVSLDDTVLSQDQGADFTAQLTPAEWNLNGGDEGHLRRFAQRVIASGSVAGTITPETDGVTGSAESFGTEKYWEAALDEIGERATVTIAITSHVGTVELGDAEMVNVPRRSTRG